MILEKFGQTIRARRKELGLSQEALAESAHVHRTYIGMIERGEKNLTLTNIKKLSEALNCTVSELVDGL